MDTGSLGLTEEKRVNRKKDTGRPALRKERSKSKTDCSNGIEQLSASTTCV